MKYESALFRARQAEREQANGTTNVELCRVTGQDLYSSVLEYHLDCGRTVRLEECYVSLSRLRFLAGRKEAIRAEVIRQLPERVRAQFPGDHGVFIKPLSYRELPAYIVMASLACDKPVSDPTADCSSLIFCWLANGIETPLPEMIEREIRAVEWDKHAVEGWD